MKKLFAIIFFTWLTALLALTYYPNFPSLKVRIRHEWFRLDYLGHFGFYAVLTALLLLWQAGWRQRIPGRLLAIAIIGGILLGALTEITQLIIPGRTMNPFDLMYNCIGVLVGGMGISIPGLAAWKQGKRPAE